MTPVDRARLRALAEKARQARAEYDTGPSFSGLGRVALNAEAELAEALPATTVLSLLEDLERVERERDEAIDVLGDVVNQACSTDSGMVTHGFLSAYERAFEFFGMRPSYQVTREQFGEIVEAKKAGGR